MKRIWMLMMACALVLSLAACGGGAESGGVGPDPGDGGQTSSRPTDGLRGSSASTGGYDAEYTIYVNGSDEWTPFPGKIGVAFANSDDGVIATSNDGAKVDFTGKQVGESIITATLDGDESTALVRVRAMEQGEDGAVPLKFIRPDRYFSEYSVSNNYPHVPYTVYFDGEAAALSYPIYGYDEHGLMGGEYNTQSVSAYLDVNDWDYTMIWRVQDDLKSAEEGWRAGMIGPVGYTYGGLPQTAGGNFFYPLNEFAEVIVVHAAHKDVREFLVEGEHDTVLGIECDVYEVPGNTASPTDLKFWVDSGTHNTLRIEYLGTEGETVVVEVLDYDMDYTGTIPFSPHE